MATENKPKVAFLHEFPKTKSQNKTQNSRAAANDSEALLNHVRNISGYNNQRQGLWKYSLYTKRRLWKLIFTSNTVFET